MRTHSPVLVMMALVGFCSQAGAQALCPELTRLRGEAAAASEKVRGFPTSDRCAAYVRFSMAWDAVTQYANDHRETCDISNISLNDFEKQHREAVEARKNVCAGRSARPYPAEIIRR
jgi:hypothetical protein